MVMVEGDVSMNSYTDGEGKPRQGLNITHRMLHRDLKMTSMLTVLGNLEVLRRPYDPSRAEGGEGEAQQE
jgi:single-stranded DNA-binding protein